MSTIDRTVPATGADLTSAEVRNNFGAAADDIEALEATAPTADEKAALAGSGTPPNAGNPYVTVADESPGVTDHGALGGLGDDDHTQYHTDARGDARYAPIGHVGAGGTQHANVIAAGAAGFMTGADKTKLDGIAAGAEANTQSNAGGGAEVGLAKSGADLPLRTLVSGDASVSITQGATTLDLRSTGVGGGESNTQTNIGGGVELGATKNGVDLPIRTLDAAQFEINLDVAKVTDGVFTPGAHATNTGNPHAVTAAQANAIPVTLTVDGDILSYDGTIYTKIGIGSNGDVLTARPAAGVGLKVAWEQPAATGGGISKGATFVDGDLLSVSDATGDGEASTTGLTAAQTPQLDAANMYTVAQRIDTDGGVAQLQYSHLGVLQGSWLYSDAGIFLLVRQDAGGTITRTEISISSAGAVSFGTPITPLTTAGDMSAQGAMLGEGGVYERVGGVNQQVMSAWRTDTLNAGYDVAPRVVDVTGGASMAFEPSLGNVVQVTTTGAATLTIQDQTEDGTVELYLPSDVTVVIAGSYTAHQDSSEGTGARVDILSKVGAILRVAYA